jgi:hypothetical protein
MFCSKVIVLNPREETYCMRQSGHSGKCSIHCDSNEEIIKQLQKEAEENEAIKNLVKKEKP